MTVRVRPAAIKTQAIGLVFYFNFATIYLMANNNKTIQEIEKLLAQNFIFDAYFKSEIKNKISALNGEQLAKLLAALTEADDFQRETLANKIREDKNFYRRVIAEKKKFDEAVLMTYKKKMEKHDKNKISALLTRLKHF